jgi:PGAP1-like protein
MRLPIRIAALIVTLLATASLQAEMRTVLHDQPLVNGHSGYLSAWAVHGSLDKVLLIVPGFDTSNSSLPADDLMDDFAPVIFHMGQLGWDVVLFDYVDGATDLKDNADNLARFIEHLDSQADENYHLAILGGSMGGIVARTMFVQEGDDMGVDTYVSLDSPHWGVYLSRWAVDLATLAIDFEAAHQMHHGDPAYEEHYGWLREVESTQHFKRNVNEPMNTLAIALSDASKGYWKVSWDDLFAHNKYYPVASYFSASGLRSTYMPYHSTAYLDSYRTKRKDRWGYSRYKYRNKTSSYFDKVIANKRDEHAAPDYAVAQGLDYILEHGP